MLKPLLFTFALAPFTLSCGGLLEASTGDVAPASSAAGAGTSGAGGSPATSPTSTGAGGSPSGAGGSPSGAGGVISGAGGLSAGAGGAPGPGAGHSMQGGSGGSEAGAGGAVLEASEASGCGWYGKLMAGLAGLKGPVLATPNGGVSLTIPAQTEDGLVLSKLTRFVEVWDTESGENHTLALGETSAGLSLLHLSQGEPGQSFLKATVVEENVSEIFPSGGSFYIMTQQGADKVRRLSHWNRYTPDSAPFVSGKLLFPSAPFQLAIGPIPDGADQLFFASPDRIVWVSDVGIDGESASTILVSPGEVITGVSVRFPTELYYTTARVGTSEGRLYRRTFSQLEISQTGFVVGGEAELVSHEIASPGAMDRYAVMTQGGLLRFWDPVSSKELLAPVTTLEAPGPDFFRLSHLEDDFILVDGSWIGGQLFDVRCPGGGFAPFFLDWQGKLSARASESGFPFVIPAPWGDGEGAPGAARIPSDQRGLYLVL